jgi:hypothetical protein
MILEKNCAERGCACFDVRVDEGVEVKVVRELSVDEIMEICDEVGRDLTKWGYFQVEFARAILAKACNHSIQGNTCEVVTSPTKD